MSVLPLRRVEISTAILDPSPPRDMTIAAEGGLATLPMTPRPAERKRSTASRGAPTREELLTKALRHARDAGITAVWTADHSASVELARLAGPPDHILSDAELDFFGLTHYSSRRLAHGPCRCAVYERVLQRGTQFDIYRWVNLVDLAATWSWLHLPRGVRFEWQRALHAAGLDHLARKSYLEGPAARSA